MDKWDSDLIKTHHSGGNCPHQHNAKNIMFQTHRVVIVTEVFKSWLTKQYKENLFKWIT